MTLELSKSSSCSNLWARGSFGRSFNQSKAHTSVCAMFGGRRTDLGGMVEGETGRAASTGLLASLFAGQVALILLQTADKSCPEPQLARKGGSQ
ncbi:uncharacterized protein UTRI_02692 [Ustilago trichophora]|uniref:Uncharacterized protein n=1 Tax=Ustilago trichophora TaxID=86804 RepID=A0A5C3EPZ0_9BASI|nr:uncharacterized protein UTRI_02692 [Ustilago trichophora]